MNLTARAKYLRIAPRKAQLVTRLISGLTVGDAEAQLLHSSKAASRSIAKLLASAVSNTLEQLEVSKDDLFIKAISVNEGPTVHRFKPRAFGRAGKIRKRTSHISITLGVRKEAGIDLEKAKKTKDSPAKPKTIETQEKELKKIKEKTDKEEQSKKDETKEAQEKEPKELKDEPQQKTLMDQRKDSSSKGANKGTDKRFMKKIFSRKVG